MERVLRRDTHPVERYVALETIELVNAETRDEKSTERSGGAGSITKLMVGVGEAKNEVDDSGFAALASPRPCFVTNMVPLMAIRHAGIWEAVGKMTPDIIRGLDDQKPGPPLALNPLHHCRYSVVGSRPIYVYATNMRAEVPYGIRVLEDIRNHKVKTGQSLPRDGNSVWCLVDTQDATVGCNRFGEAFTARAKIAAYFNASLTGAGLRSCCEPILCRRRACQETIAEEWYNVPSSNKECRAIAVAHKPTVIAQCDKCRPCEGLRSSFAFGFEHKDLVVCAEKSRASPQRRRGEGARGVP